MDRQLEKIIELIEKGKHEEGLKKADDLFNEADDETKRSLAELYFELGLLNKTIPIIEELMFRYPDHGELYAFAAECYIEDGREDEAIEMLLEVSKEDNTFLQAQILLADLYESQGLEEVAEQKLMKALENSPDELVVHYALGEFYLQRGAHQKAIFHFKRVSHDFSEKDSFPVHPNLRLAESFSAVGEFEEAIEAYRKGLKDGETIEGLFGLGITAMQINDFELASKTFEKLLKIEPDYTTAYAYLARAYVEMNNIKAAKEILDKGLKKDEFNEDLYLESAKILFKHGEKEEAAESLQKLIALNPSNYQAAKLLFEYYNDEELYEDMEELISYLDDYGEYDPLFERYRGKSLFEKDDVMGAAEAYRIVLAELTSDADFLEEAAYVFLSAGEKHTAIKIYEDLLGMTPEREDLAERLDELKKL